MPGAARAAASPADLYWLHLQPLGKDGQAPSIASQGDPLGCQECSVSHCLSPHSSRRKCSPVDGAGHSHSPCLELSSWLCLGQVRGAHLCHSRSGMGKTKGPSGDCCFCTWQGAALGVLCSLALSNEQQEPTAKQVGFIWHSLVAHFCTSCRASV